MNQQLSLLIELGDLETQLAGLWERRRSIPVEREELKAGLNRLRASIEAKEKELDDLGHERRMIENEVEDEQYKLDQHKVQLLQLKTNREYEAMELEIEAGEKKISRLEDRVLELMERDDELRADLGEDKRKHQESEAESERKGRELDQGDRSLGERIATLETSVSGLTERIDDSLHREYQRIRNGKTDNQAIVALTAKGACGGCYSSITLQTVNEVKMGDKIITCYNCGRILYHNSESGHD